MFTGFNRRFDRGLSFIAIPAARKATVALLALAAVAFLLDGDTPVRQADASNNYQETPQREIRVSSDNFWSIGAGLENSCGQLTDGTVHCWGDNRSGRMSPHAENFQHRGTAAGTGNPPVPEPVQPDTIAVSSTTPHARVELKLTVNDLFEDLQVGSAIEIYLEDEFQVPDHIDPDDVYFRAYGGSPHDASSTGGGQRIYASYSPDINQGDWYDGDDDWAIRVDIPNMNTRDDDVGFDGPKAGQTLTLVFSSSAGIKNPSEEGSHSVGYSILGPVDVSNDGPQVELDNIEGSGAPTRTYAKIRLSDTDNQRGYYMTVTGSGFNDGSIASVFVQHIPDGDPNISEAELCSSIINNGALVGQSTVAADHKALVSFVVAVPPFQPGDRNYLCMVDDEGRTSSTDVAWFHLEPSIRVGSATVQAGENINVFAQDYVNVGATFNELRIAGQVVWSSDEDASNSIVVSHSSIAADGSAMVSFALPDSVPGAVLRGPVSIEAQWGDVRKSARVVVTDNAPFPYYDATPPVTNVDVCSGPNTGEATVSWDAVLPATHYRIGYVNLVQDYPRATASATGEWIEAFIYVDVNARNIPVSSDGRAQYTLRRLATGDRHAFTVLTSGNVVNTRETFSGSYSWPQNPRWQYLTVAAPESACDDAAITTITEGDYDVDNDGLIEIASLTQLDAIRHDLDGDGSVTHPDYVSAFPNALADMGCPATGCIGYELTVNLNFDINGSGHADLGDAYWNGGWGWTPIGDPDPDYRWNAVFDGGGHTIANLYVNWGDTDHVGLFRATGSDSNIRNVGLEAANVAGNNQAGGLVGSNAGTVSNSFATGVVSGNGLSVGGLVGHSNGAISDSYTNTQVTGKGNHVGGLAGSIGDNVSITTSYATGAVTSESDFAGGLIGLGGDSSSISASYATGPVSGKNFVGGLIGRTDHGSTLTGSYARGDVTGQTHTERVRSSPAGRRNTVVRDGQNVGGLLGYSANTAIAATYATGTVSGGNKAVGALVGGASGGSIATSYAANSASMRMNGFRSTSMRFVGRLIGSADDDHATSIADSYWDTQAAGVTGAGGKTTRELQTPTANTGIYADWNPNWWDFGTVRQYPVLQYGGLDVARQRR